MKNPPDSERDTLLPAAKNRDMFDGIAPHYDRTNRFISLGSDSRWRKKAVDQLQPIPEGHYLDVGTGTGDLALEILRREPTARVTGIDPAGNMLKLARKKAEDKKVTNRVEFLEQDVLTLSEPEATYDGIILGFSFRNIEHRQQALELFFRFLKPGGRLIILEATRPKGSLQRAGHLVFTKGIALFAGGKKRNSAYRYLAESIVHFPEPEQVLALFQQTEFIQTHHTPLMFGAVSIFSGVKP